MSCHSCVFAVMLQEVQYTYNRHDDDDYVDCCDCGKRLICTKRKKERKTKSLSFELLCGGFSLFVVELMGSLESDTLIFVNYL